MKFKLSVLFSFLALLGLLASSNSFALEQSITDHPHHYPYTKVLADEYHLRLVVDHNESKLALVFADISEKAVRLVTFKTIDGEVFLPGGETKEIKLTAVKDKSKRTRRDPLIFNLGKRKAGVFEYKADWIENVTELDLIVSFPFGGKDYKFVFEYSTGGHMFPQHMGW
ncbi:MAG: hypothetical protein ABFS18_11540 [Thermodesulfobacteriota bacterium]